MNGNKLTVAAIVVGVFALAVSGFAFFHAPSQVVFQQPPVGALAGPDISSPYLAWGSGQTSFWPFTQSFASATATPCSIPIPPMATSSLRYFFAVPKSSTSTDLVAVLATSSTPYAPAWGTATSSILAWAYIPANSQTAFAWQPPLATNGNAGLGNVNATSTAFSSLVANPMVSGVVSTTSKTYLVFYYLNNGSLGAAGSGQALNGTCSGEFVGIR